MIILKGNCITALKEEVTVELDDARSYSISASGSLIGWSGRVSDLILSSTTNRKLKDYKWDDTHSRSLPDKRHS